MRLIPATGRQRGNSLFTMIIFVMMLISTGLMYYYFQRARALERDLAAIRNGEMDPNESGSDFFSRMPWTSRNAAGTAPPASSSGTSLADPGQPAAPPNDRPVPPAPASQDPIVAASEPQDEATTEAAPVEDQLAQEPDTVSQEDEQETLVMDADADEDGPNDQNAANNDAGQSPSQDSPQATPAAQPTGDSLYNLEPPPVRVRAPRRN